MSLRPLNTQSLHGDREGAAHLLSPVGYDDDAASLHSPSDQDSDSDDDQLQLRARNSRELRAADRIVFMEEDEVDRLVTDSRRQRQESQRRGSGLALPNPLRLLRRASDSNLSVNDESADDYTNEKRHQRKTRRRQKKEKLMEMASHGEDGGLMYEMEEGGMKEGSSTGDSSDREDSNELDRRRLGMVASAKSDRRRSWLRWLLMHTLIAVGFTILLLLAWKLSLGKNSARTRPQLVSNGTALFAPTTIIISLDGFRADFLQRGITPRLNAFVAEGVSPKYMMPSFPSVTFPNHYTLATGLYPESHGIVGNTFWDPELQAEFYYTDPARSLDPKWWSGEPFWVTAERQGIRTAVHMWPGSEAHIDGVEPSFLDKYNGKELLPNKVSRILEFLDMPGKEDHAVAATEMRPQLIAAYVPNVDGDGHRYGPNSTEIRSTIESADGMMEELFAGLEARNLTHIVNVIVVSDHGMASTDTARVMQLEDLVDVDKIEHTDGWPLYGLRPKDPADLQGLYDGLEEKAKTNPNIEVYLRDVNMPERYHFSKNQRIAPLWIVPKTGWAIAAKKEFDVAAAVEKGEVYHPRGLHGYDHEHPLMRAIFIARGPAFHHPPNSEIAPFQNIEVYNILCDSVGLVPKPNNGTLRLPLKPFGLHKPEDAPTELADPEPTTSSTIAAVASATQETTTSPVAVSTEKVASVSTKEPTSTASSASATPTGGDDPDKDLATSIGDGIKHAWDWVTGKIGDAWDKIQGSGSD
ncbi:putative pyrophosphatase/phosphodiesterase like protein [Verticillium longisporum]|uniref:Putative pyrophosphatase/phosphodiesterase like protein n=1 Tax=Verticillium longisporum TaxID=100787 RepID=A0A8I2ZSW2_VERLO|nr:putative pyrophosphatase/phosphodiesterase like protein [Verticillium longisporum]KAG7138277.1 putative pyrophosphatase/phosphodiesterase like protein [Verticillium longisporum]